MLRWPSGGNRSCAAQPLPAVCPPRPLPREPPAEPTARCPPPSPCHCDPPPPTGAVTRPPASSRLPIPGDCPSPPTPDRARSIFISREFFMSYQIELEMQGGRGPAGEWGVGAPSAKTASSGRRHFSPRSCCSGGGLLPPFSALSCHREKLGPLPCPPLTPSLGRGHPSSCHFMDCLCNRIHQRPVFGGSGRGPGGPPEAFLPHFMSPASPLLGLKKEVGDPLKEEVPFSPTLPLWHSCPWLGAGPWGSGLGFPSLPQPIRADIKIKIHPVLSVASVCVRGAEGNGEQRSWGRQTNSQRGLGPQRGAQQTLLGKTLSFVLGFQHEQQDGQTTILSLYLDSSATCHLQFSWL